MSYSITPVDPYYLGSPREDEESLFKFGFEQDIDEHHFSPEIYHLESHDFVFQGKTEHFLEEPEILFQDHFRTQGKDEKLDLCQLSNLAQASPPEGCDKKSTEVTEITKQVFEILEKPKKRATDPNRVIHRRWGRKEDKVLFQVIRDLEAEGLLSLQTLLSTDSSVDLCRHEGMLELCKRSFWKATPAKLMARIKALRQMRFSFRELKALRGILKEEYDYQNINFEKVIHEFPGKTLEALKEACDTLVHSCHQKK